ncbi:MAG TPA: DUF5678 domain-containing protein [Solirubrobacteraceae bacterium]|nr:DUF5678 domain-containing protein [Solirubrobacteraceae bacterium]
MAEQVRAEEKLSEALEEFAGDWVAVREHAVVAHASGLEELLDEIKDTEVEAFFQVAEDSSACFF